MMTGLKRVTPGRVALYACASLLAALWLFPIVWMVFSSFNSFATPVSILRIAFSPPFTFANYIHVSQRAPIWTWTYNSAVVAIVVTFVILITTSMAAYALSKLNFRGGKLVFIIIMSGLMVPIEAIVIPLFLNTVDMGLLNTRTSLILPSLAAPLGVIIMKQFYDGIPNELIEAAKIDGSTYFHTWWSICVPLSRSALAAVGIFTFINSWNNFLWPFLAVTNQSMMTLPVGIPVFQNTHLEEFTRPMTASVFASVPAIIVFIIFQKQIVRGIAMSGIKG